MRIALVDIVSSLIILCLLSGAGLYIYREKKKGTRCIGCPIAGKCEKSVEKTECACSSK